MRRQSPQEILLWLTILFFLFPFFYAFGFCYPRGDDFDSATRAMFLFDLPGGLYEIAREWLTWSGRFFYHFLAVFLGACADSRWLIGLVCCLVLLLWGLAGWRLARILQLSRPGLFAALIICALCAAYPNLPDFYLFTDSLTMNLQGCLFLIFAAELISVWQRSDEGWKLAALWAILAIGVYEHAALAVLTTTSFALILAWLGIRRSKARKRAKARLRAFSKIFLTALLAIGVSFCAPGNFQRARMRQAPADLPRLDALVTDFTQLASQFCVSSLALAALCLSILAIDLSPRKPHYSLLRRIGLAALTLAACLLFVLTVLLMHSFTDVPFGSEPKLAASLCSFMAIALGIATYFILFPACNSRLPRFNIRGLFYPTLFIFISALFLSQNFYLTAANAVNGQFSQLACFMTERENYLRSLTGETRKSPRGLWAELSLANARQRRVRPGLPQAVVQAWQRPVFPVYIREGLASQPTLWPNLWAAWIYEAGSIRAIPPDPIPDMKNKRSVKLLAVPQQLASKGMEKAWIAPAAGQNATFNNLWLVFRAVPKPMQLRIFLPSPVESARPVPIFLQKILAKWLAEKTQLQNSWLANLAAAQIIVCKPEQRQEVYAVPLGLSAALKPPDHIFVSLEGIEYYRLSALEE